MCQRLASSHPTAKNEKNFGERCEYVLLMTNECLRYKAKINYGTVSESYTKAQHRNFNLKTKQNTHEQQQQQNQAKYVLYK